MGMLNKLIVAAIMAVGCYGTSFAQFWNSSIYNGNPYIYNSGGNVVVTGARFTTAGDSSVIYFGANPSALWTSQSIKAVWGSGMRISTFGYPDLVTINQTGNVGIGTTAPVSNLEVNGSIGYKVTWRTTNVVISKDDNVVITTNSAILPSRSSCQGRVYTIKNQYGNTPLTVKCAAGTTDAIESWSGVNRGYTTITITPNASQGEVMACVQLMADNKWGGWIILSHMGTIAYVN
jgi:hypothetical protein